MKTTKTPDSFAHRVAAPSSPVVGVANDRGLEIEAPFLPKPSHDKKWFGDVTEVRRTLPVEGRMQVMFVVEYREIDR